MKTAFHASFPALVWLVLMSHSFSTTGVGGEYRGGEKVVVKMDEVIDEDLYVAGTEVIIDGTVKGDLVAFAGQVHVNGTVEGDVMAAGQCVVLNGQVQDGARIAGQVLKVTSKAKVGNDLLAMGFSLETENGCAIDGDVLYAGYQAKVGGTIAGNLTAALVNCELGGSIGGDAQLKVDGDKGTPPTYAFGQPPPIGMPQVPGGLTIDETAKIDGKLSYRSPREAKIHKDAVIAGTIDHTVPKVEPAKQPSTQTILLNQIRHLSCVGLVGLVLLFTMPRWTQRLADTVRGRPVASLGAGILSMLLFWVVLGAFAVAVTVAAFLFALATLGELVPHVLIIGIITGLGYLIAFWFFWSYVAEVIVSFTIGRLLLVAKGDERRLPSFLLGLVILGLVSSIPFAGTVVGWIVLLLALGALLLWLWNIRSPVVEPTMAPVTGK